MLNTIVRLAEKRDLLTIQALAEKIWLPTYASILDSGQIDYMMKQIYSRESLMQQMHEHHHIFLILDYESNPSGFASYSPHAAEASWKLQKIYVDPALQGKGLGKFLLEDVVARVKAAGGKALQLNVNRHNKARFFYEMLGFEVVKEVDIDIGNGYFMNDYVMEKLIDG
jgi:ribosomal protein S18 acetylase RimI-like enzyme